MYKRNLLRVVYNNGLVKYTLSLLNFSSSTHVSFVFLVHLPSAQGTHHRFVEGSPILRCKVWPTLQLSLFDYIFHKFSEDLKQRVWRGSHSCAATLFTQQIRTPRSLMLTTGAIGLQISTLPVIFSLWASPISKLLTISSAHKFNLLIFIWYLRLSSTRIYTTHRFFYLDQGSTQTQAFS